MDPGRLAGAVMFLLLGGCASRADADGAVLTADAAAGSPMPLPWDSRVHWLLEGRTY
jgi:hypothetical protein